MVNTVYPLPLLYMSILISFPSQTTLDIQITMEVLHNIGKLLINA